MKFLVLCLCVVLATQAVLGEECEYTMEKMCSLIPNATYTTRGCWYYCRIKAQFEVFTGTLLNGSTCRAMIGGVEGVCRNGLCFPNGEK